MKKIVWIILLSLSLCGSNCFELSAQLGFGFAEIIKNMSADELYNRGLASYKAGKYANACEWFRKAANKGDIISMSNLGQMYYEGLPGVEKNKELAFDWYAKAAQKNDAVAQYYLGVMYGNGETRSGVKDYKKALYWLQLALDNGQSEAQAAINHFKQEMSDEKDVYTGYDSNTPSNNHTASTIAELQEMFTKGVNYFSSQDYINALKWFRKGAEQGFSPAQFFLGVMYHSGLGVEKNLGEAVKLYKKAAEQGIPDAQCSLGNMYEYGQGVNSNYTEAVKWYKKAAEQGNERAIKKLQSLQLQTNKNGSTQMSAEEMFNKGWSYDQAKDYRNAFIWYKKAAEQGNPEAQCNLGNMYYLGQGIAQNYTEAFKWYKKAAEQGNAKAQNSLGNKYYLGEGIAQNYTEAFKWYKKAAEQGNAEAQNALGMMYYLGQGIAQNYAEALKWYKKAAEQGNLDAPFFLGDMYRYGQGVTKNLSTAKYWYQKATKSDIVEVATAAQASLKELE